jgi:hypothetical protein
MAQDGKNYSLFGFLYALVCLVLAKINLFLFVIFYLFLNIRVYLFLFSIRLLVCVWVEVGVFFYGKKVCIFGRRFVIGRIKILASLKVFMFLFFLGNCPLAFVERFLLRCLSLSLSDAFQSIFVLLP